VAKVMEVACKLPFGLVLEHPKTGQKVVLSGKNKAAIIGQDYGTTEVDETFWSDWIAVHADFPAITSGAIFVARSSADLAAIAKENQKRKTGMEAAAPDSGGIKTLDLKD